MTDTSITPPTAQKLSVKPPKACLYCYLTELSRTRIVDGKLVTTDVDVEGLRRLGRDTIASLGASLSGMALVPCDARDGSSYESFGFICSSIGEIIETICSIDAALDGLNEKMNWPIQLGEEGAEVTLSRLLWLIPYANNPPQTVLTFSLKELENLLVCFLDTAPVNLRIYNEILESAMLDILVPRAVQGRGGALRDHQGGGVWGRAACISAAQGAGLNAQ